MHLEVVLRRRFGLAVDSRRREKKLAVPKCARASRLFRDSAMEAISVVLGI